MAQHGQVGAVRGQRELLGDGLGSGVVAAGRLRVRRARPGADQRSPACATDGDEMFTSRATPAARQAVHHRTGAVDVDPLVVGPRPDHVDLGGQVQHRVLAGRPRRGPARGRRYRPAPRRCPARPVRRCSTVTSSPRSISASATARPVIPLAPVTRTFIGRPCRTTPPPTAVGPLADRNPVDLRVVPDVDRQRPADQHGSHVLPGGRARRGGQRGRGQRPTGAGQHDDHLLGPGRADPDHGRPGSAPGRRLLPPGPPAPVVRCRPGSPGRPRW